MLALSRVTLPPAQTSPAMLVLFEVVIAPSEVTLPVTVAWFDMLIAVAE